MADAMGHAHILENSLGYSWLRGDMKKVSILLQWFLVVCFCVIIIHFLFRPQPKPHYDPKTWHSWKGFIALSYLGITRDGGREYVSPKRLAEQLEALKQAGYRTITPDDAAAFLAGRSPLPDKALLLMFEGGRKDSFLHATPLLRKYALMAVMCVPTQMIRTWGSFYLNQHDLKILSEQPHWRLCSMGDEAINSIPIDASGTKGRFLTRPRWLENKLEDPSSFRDRVTSDYAKAAKILERATGNPVAAYLYPFADPATRANADPLAAPMNRKAVATHHRIAFTRADHPFNGPGSNPYDLGRLRVPGNWDGTRLVQEAEKFFPRQGPVTGLGDSGIWIIRGNAQMHGNLFRIGAGSGAWIRGSDSWTNMDMSANIRLASGTTTSLYARYVGPHSYVRLSINQKDVRLQERLDSTMQTLAWHPITETANRTHELRLRVKGNRAWAWYNGIPVAASVPLTPGTNLGHIGLGSQGAMTEILGFQAKPLPSIFVLADDYRALPHALQEEMSVILPLWFTQDADSKLDDQRRKDLLVAASAGVKTIPLIRTNATFNLNTTETLSTEIASVLNDPAVKPLITHIAITENDNKLSLSLRKHGYEIIRIITPQQAISLVEHKQLPGKDLLLIDGPEGESRVALQRLLHVIPANRLIALLESRAPVEYGVRIAIRFEAISERSSK